jgi:hypothetical protein
MAKVYTTIPDKAGGDTFTEVMWDVSIRDNVNNLMSPAACKVRAGTTQVIVTGTITDKNFDTEVFDTDGMHDNVTNNPRITPTTAGLYVCTAGVLWNGGSTGYRQLLLNFNAAIFLSTSLQTGIAAVAEQGTSAIESFNGTTDYVKAQVTHTQGANETLTASTASDFRPHLSAVWIGRAS